MSERSLAEVIRSHPTFKRVDRFLAGVLIVAIGVGLVAGVVLVIAEFI